MISVIASHGKEPGLGDVLLAPASPPKVGVSVGVGVVSVGVGVGVVSVGVGVGVVSVGVGVGVFYG
jgi:hypothetical protein